MLVKKKLNSTAWEQDAHRGPGINVNFIDHFDARGMRRVYGRGDHFGKGHAFNMDVWLTRSGRLLARFWARRDEVDWLSLEIIGFAHTPPPKNKKRETNEDWVPQCVRDKYDRWITSEF